MKIKKPYTIITDYYKREEIVLYAKANGNQTAQNKYGLSIPTLKRWRANYYSEDTTRSLHRKYSQPSRIDKYEAHVRAIEDFLNKNKVSIRKNQKLTRDTREEFRQLVNLLKNLTTPPIRVWTVYRLIHDVLKQKKLTLDFKNKPHNQKTNRH